MSERPRRSRAIFGVALVVSSFAELENLIDGRNTASDVWYGLSLGQERGAVGRQRLAKADASQKAQGQADAGSRRQGQWQEVEGPRFRRTRLRAGERADGRTPAEPHHLRFAQSRALGQKVSDEYTVPVCRLHHRELHRYGDEVSWWAGVNVDPVRIALELWRRTRPNQVVPFLGEMAQPDSASREDVTDPA
jgi:hypothetical protein